MDSRAGGARDVSASAHERGATIGVVVPTLNEAELLPRLLERLTSVEDRYDRANAIVVADGGSTDRTVELARERASVVRGARGRGLQLQAGARELATDVLLFLHADSLPEPGAIKAVRAAFEDPALGVTAMHQRVERDGAFYRCVETCADLRTRLGVVYGDCGLAVRRELYEAVGGFRPLPLFEDVDLSRRLRRRASVRLVRGAHLRISARRWESEGALRCTLRNWMLSIAFLFGSDPERLARRYAPSSRTP